MPCSWLLALLLWSDRFVLDKSWESGLEGRTVHSESNWVLQWKRRDMDFDPREHEPCLSPAAFVNQVQYSNILEGRFKQLQGKTVCSLRPHSLSLFFLRCICRSSSASQLTFKPCQITCLLFFEPLYKSPETVNNLECHIQKVHVTSSRSNSKSHFPWQIEPHHCGRHLFLKSWWCTDVVVVKSLIDGRLAHEY